MHKLRPHCGLIMEQLAPDRDELLIRDLQQARDAVEAAPDQLGNRVLGFVSKVVLDLGPRVLQRSPALDLQPEVRVRRVRSIFVPSRSIPIRC